FLSKSWYGNVEDPLEEQKTLKFRGDLAYRRKQYQSCFSLIPAGNISVKRDVLEGIARCCCHLGKKEEALNACEKLVNIVNYLVQQLLYMLLLWYWFIDRGQNISSLQQLCCLHPYHPWYWLNLAMSFQRLLESDGCLDRRSTEEEHDQQQGTSNILRLKTIMCLIRTRYVSHKRTSCLFTTLTLTDEFSTGFVHLVCSLFQVASSHSCWRTARGPYETLRKLCMFYSQQKICFRQSLRSDNIIYEKKIYIYIYIEREREREREMNSLLPKSQLFNNVLSL
uniref:Zgc:101716 n=1 Tax=Cyprinus carpio TaxID=7962 RepID=A0A8C1TD15_CYPCA